MKNFLKVYREKDLNQKEFADFLGVSAVYVRQLERGEANPTLTTLKEFAKKLNISIIDFFSIEEFDNSKYYSVLKKDQENNYLDLPTSKKYYETEKELNEQRAKSLSLYERMDNLLEENRRLNKLLLEIKND